METVYQQEQKILNKLKSEFPEKFVPAKKNDHELLEYINAKDPRVVLPKAFLKYAPFDFIVEEIDLGSHVIRVDQPINSTIVRSPDSTGTVFAELIKIGISTVDAVRHLRDALGADEKQIQYGGIKDAGSVTAQTISFRGIAAEKIQQLHLPNIILTNIREGKGVMNTGGIMGNVFTIFLRTELPVSNTDFLNHIARSQTKGIPNYYGVQRFGSPRYLSHTFGKYLCRGDVEGLLKSIFFEVTDFEWPYASDMRRRAQSQWGNWKSIIEIFQELPHTFRLELDLLKSLEKGGTTIENYERTLNTIQDQLDFWVKAYGSFYTNKILLDAEISGQSLPNKIPLLASRHPDVFKFYGKFLELDGTLNYLQNVRRFPCIKISQSADLDARVFPVWHGFKIIPGGVVMSFELGKGSYATTVLNDFFEIVSVVVPDWVTRDLVDTKQTLGTGSMQALFEKFQHLLDDYILGK